MFLVNSTSPYKDKNSNGPFCRAFVDICLEMALLLQLFMAGRSACCPKLRLSRKGLRAALGGH